MALNSYIRGLSQQAPVDKFLMMSMFLVLKEAPTDRQGPPKNHGITSVYNDSVTDDALIQLGELCGFRGSSL